MTRRSFPLLRYFIRKRFSNLKIECFFFVYRYEVYLLDFTMQSRKV